MLAAVVHTASNDAPKPSAEGGLRLDIGIDKTRARPIRPAPFSMEDALGEPWALGAPRWAAGDPRQDPWEIRVTGGAPWSRSRAWSKGAHHPCPPRL